MNRSKLRSIVSEEVRKILQDDALFKDPDISGIIDKFDIAGDYDSHGRNLSYGPEKSTDSEGRSTKKQLYYISRKSQSLHDLLRDDDDLPEWVQSKITRAADKIQSVYQYLEYKIKEERH
tara:strand:+ start:145 stop:504 length:360 start_codon:yes stop_codon:yes gene_type:complete